MENVFNFLRLARPFLELAYSGALLVAPAIAAEIRAAIDAIDRAAAVDHPARGLAEITAFCNRVLDSLRTLVDDTTIPIDVKRTQANDLLHSLSDPMQVYQAQHGNDASVLANSKGEARRLVDQIG